MEPRCVNMREVYLEVQNVPINIYMTTIET